MRNIFDKTYLNNSCMVLMSYFSSLNQKKSIWVTFSGKIQIVFLFCLIFSIANAASGQKTFRRHFVITYDASVGFNDGKINEILDPLFSGDRIAEIGDQSIINQEKSSGKVFFDPKKDEISFFDFNLNEHDFKSLKGEPNQIKSTEKISEMFFKPQTTWTKYRLQYPDILDYIIARLNNPRNRAEISFPNIVYPLVLNRLDQIDFAEEYILIILTQNTPETFNVEDKRVLTSNMNNFVTDSFDKQISILSESFSKTNYFNFPGIFGYFVSPKNVKPGSSLTSVRINKSLELSQLSYDGSQFDLSSIPLQFPDNNLLKPSLIGLTISILGKAGNEEIFNDIIATSDNEANFSSNYESSGNFFRRILNRISNFSNSRSTYVIPRLRLDLDKLKSNKDFNGLKLNFEIKSKAKTNGNNSLNFIFYAETFVPAHKIDLIGYGEYLGYIIVPIIFLLILAVFLVVYGKPKKIEFTIHGYIDSFERIDYRTVGKVLTPYKVWNSKYQKLDFLLIEGRLTYNSPGYFLNWNPGIVLKLQNVSIPNGFDIFLKYNATHLKEFGSGYAMSINKDKKNRLSFVVGIRQNDITKEIIDPELIKFIVDAEFKKSVLFFKSELLENIEYKFHIGPEMGDVWVAFDPGTTGSCVAVGSTTDNIILGEDRAKNKIIPSILVFEKSENFHQNGTELSERFYKYGAAAETLYTNPIKYQGFQSIKKLLGFNDIKKVVFDNGNTLEMTGKDLAALLVKGLFKDINNHFNSSNFKIDEYLLNGLFNPLRAVVAIPNNFTISKIQDIIDCISNLNQFKEIRYVYEAEAILFYYLSNYSRLNENNGSFESETILVFDMGGATINATVVTAKKILVNDIPKYDIDFLGKIGYGIGGDTIDYCLVKIILSHTAEFPVFENVNIVEEKIQLSSMAKKIKEALVRSYYSTREEILITSPILENLIRVGTGYSISINEEESEFFKLFRRDKKNLCKLFSHSIFVNTIYNNVVDAVKEVLDLSNNSHIDRVIFSGRSTAYPMIRENVHKQIKSSVGETKSIYLNLEESKTAVAKGACWYGINKNSVRLNHLKTNASFGFKKTLSADRTNVKFYELVEMGCVYDTDNEGIDSFNGSTNISDNFAFDGSKVNFYQIMGKDADKILSEGQKHKFSKIATISLPLVSDLIAMKVKENDEVECVVKLKSTQLIREKGVVSDQQIDEANEEHYTWIVN